MTEFAYPLVSRSGLEPPAGLREEAPSHVGPEEGVDTPRVSLGGLVAPRWQVRQGAARWLEGGPSPRGPQERV